MTFPWADSGTRRSGAATARFGLRSIRSMTWTAPGVPRFDPPYKRFGDETVTVDLRWLFAHMIDEYARHNGHADLIRELVDGTTGL